MQLITHSLFVIAVLLLTSYVVRNRALRRHRLQMTKRASEQKQYRPLDTGRRSRHAWYTSQFHITWIFIVSKDATHL
jgi:hypothetical protein